MKLHVLSYIGWTSIHWAWAHAKALACHEDLTLTAVFPWGQSVGTHILARGVSVHFVLPNTCLPLEENSQPYILASKLQGWNWDVYLREIHRVLAQDGWDEVVLVSRDYNRVPDSSWARMSNALDQLDDTDAYFGSLPFVEAYGIASLLNVDFRNITTTSHSLNLNDSPRLLTLALKNVPKHMEDISKDQLRDDASSAFVSL
ncbi:hypothetical protein VM1G_11219 [Cytospora mali]|uniref:Uncharacterized protein n=1 Tax=Cytospora mali TaxID=578113 RepID=A0A194VJV0_CYTMA|nr:hypothetical protein VM1G_11219 [Valsa mali]